MLCYQADGKEQVLNLHQVVADAEGRDFKGVWIDKSVWLDPRLTALEKVILTEIDSLDGPEGCWASNEYIAGFCQCSESKVSRTIAKLIDLGYVRIGSFDGRKRVLKSCLCEKPNLGKKPRQTKRESQADKHKSPAININNNTKNNKKEITKEKSFVQEICDLLNEGKAKARCQGRLKTAYGDLVISSLLSDGITRDEIHTVAQEIAKGGKNTDWYDFKKLF